MQRLRESLQAGMFQAFDQNPQRLIQRHSRREQMGELFGEEIKMGVGERLHRPGGNRGALRARFRRRCRTAHGPIDRLDLDGNPTLRLHLHNRARAIITSENPIY